MIYVPYIRILDLMNYVVAQIPDKWQLIGLGLGVREGDLNGIQAQYSRDPNWPQCCFGAVLSKWHNGATSEYSWKHLVEVLLSPSVNQCRVVESIYDNLQ